MSEKSIRILVVEDDAFTRIMIKRTLKGQNVVLTECSNGEEALALMDGERFDAAIVDWMMPKMDGIEFIRRVRARRGEPPYIIMLTAISSDEGKRTAMESGADAYMTKPYDNDQFLEVLNNGVHVSRLGRQTEQIVSRSTAGGLRKRYTAVGIASSTGGPQTLLQFFTDLPRIDSAAFFIVQHGPAWMLASFAERLGSVASMDVRLGAEGMPITPGTIYLAPGDRHMIVDPVSFELRLIDDPPENYCKPAADPLFRSIAAAFGRASVSIVLSGMGRDGTIGSGYIRAAGGIVVAQDPETAILPSMPKSVAELMIATRIIPLPMLGKEMAKILLPVAAGIRSAAEPVPL
ncbi:MAG: response regulator [Bacteroidetes bacterium]|nr:response regulator [Bacteroidota bacterium]